MYILCVHTQRGFPQHLHIQTIKFALRSANKKKKKRHANVAAADDVQLRHMQRTFTFHKYQVICHSKRDPAQTVGLIIQLHNEEETS